MVVQDDTLLEVIPDSLARMASVPLVSPDNLKSLDAEWVTVIVPISGMSAIQLVTILRPLVPTTGQINALQEFAMWSKSSKHSKRCLWTPRRGAGKDEERRRLPPRPESREHFRQLLRADIEMFAHPSPQHCGRHVAITALFLRLVEHIEDDPLSPVQTIANVGESVIFGRRVIDQQEPHRQA